jgi:hypothetical protein
MLDNGGERRSAEKKPNGVSGVGARSTMLIFTLFLRRYSASFWKCLMSRTPSTLALRVYGGRVPVRSGSGVCWRLSRSEYYTRGRCCMELRRCKSSFSRSESCCTYDRLHTCPRVRSGGLGNLAAGVASVLGHLRQSRCTNGFGLGF